MNGLPLRRVLDAEAWAEKAHVHPKPNNMPRGQRLGMVGVIAASSIPDSFDAEYESVGTLVEENICMLDLRELAVLQAATAESVGEFDLDVEAWLLETIRRYWHNICSRARRKLEREQESAIPGVGKLLVSGTPGMERLSFRSDRVSMRRMSVPRPVETLLADECDTLLGTARAAMCELLLRVTKRVLTSDPMKQLLGSVTGTTGVLKDETAVTRTFRDLERGIEGAQVAIYQALVAELREESGMILLPGLVIVEVEPGRNCYLLSRTRDQSN